MTHKFYKGFQIVFFSLFVPIFLLNQFGDKINWLTRHTAIMLIIFYAKPVLSLSLLYFGIYARTCRIENISKFDGPISLIVGGLLFTLISFGPPIVSFLFVYDSEIEPLTIAELQATKETALASDKKVESRLTAAKYYYQQTGEAVEYLDEHGIRTLYSPGDIDRKEREEHVQMIQDIRRMLNQSKNIVINLMAFAIVSCLGFLMLLKYRFRHSAGEKRGSCLHS